MKTATYRRTVIAAVPLAWSRAPAPPAPSRKAAPADGGGRVERRRVVARPGTLPTPIGVEQEAALDDALAPGPSATACDGTRAHRSPRKPWAPFLTPIAGLVRDAWYFTPGGFQGALTGVLNKHSFVTGKKVGF
jgi:hypothetical protein